MKIEYIYHSGFTIETDKYFLVFDYYKGNLQLKDKKTIVFSSHGHPDHFNPVIFEWAKQQANISYILSSDIASEISESIHIMEPYETLELFDITINTFGSTDLGLSFLVKVEGKTIFFAGDLNWWYWNENSEQEKLSMEKAFKKEIDNLKRNLIDIAFFPVDPRLKENYSLGGKHFIKEISPKIFIPMHFGDNYKITKEFAQEINRSENKVLEISKRNQIFVI